MLVTNIFYLNERLCFPVKGLDLKKDELDFRKMSELKTHLPPLVIEIPIPMQKSAFGILRNQQSATNIKLL